MKRSQSFSSPEAVKCVLLHHLSDDLSVIVGDCDILELEHLTQPAWDRIRQIRATAMKMAEMIAKCPCPACEKEPEPSSPPETPIEMERESG